MGNTTARSKAARWALGVAVGCGLAVGVAPATAAHAAGPLLRWKFAQGESLHYQIDQKTATEAKVNGQDIKTTVSQVMDTTWNVKSVGKDGTAEMTQTLDRIHTKMETPFGAFEYDSKEDKKPEGPAAVVVPILKAMVGAPFQFKMSPQGELTEVQVPPSLVKALKEAGPAAGGLGMFSEDGLKNMIREMSLVLPDKELEQPWTRQARIPSPPIGTMILDKTYKYEGNEGGNEKIGLDVKVALEPAADAKNNLKIEIGDQKGQGSFLFDNKAGRVVSSNVSEKVGMVITVMNMTINQSTENETTMKLVDPKAGASK